MKESLATGLSTTRQIDVDQGRTIGFMGDEGRVYSTPALVGDIERTCRDFLLEHLDANEDSVGTRVEIDHLAPTPLGMPVEITATITEMKGRAITLEVVAQDPVEEVARCRHNRFVIDTDRTKARIAAKVAKAKG